jgi:hypothetical protein
MAVLTVWPNLGNRAGSWLTDVDGRKTVFVSSLMEAVDRAERLKAELNVPRTTYAEMVHAGVAPPDPPDELRQFLEVPEEVARTAKLQRSEDE